MYISREKEYTHEVRSACTGRFLASSRPLPLTAGGAVRARLSSFERGPCRDRHPHRRIAMASSPGPPLSTPLANLEHRDFQHPRRGPVAPPQPGPKGTGLRQGRTAPQKPAPTGRPQAAQHAQAGPSGRNMGLAGSANLATSLHLAGHTKFKLMSVICLCGSSPCYYCP